jgi:exodeoxyribonuclease-3
MKIVSLNLNGLLNAVERGFKDWLEDTQADIVCVQDLRIREKDIPDDLFEIGPFYGFFFDADQPEQGGVGIYCRDMPKAIIRGLGNPEVDMEGRYLQADFSRFSVCSVLFPYAFDDEDLDHKLGFMEVFGHHLRKTQRKRRDFIFTGTFHMAHKTIDLGNWQDHQRTPGFLPEERAWLDQVMGPMGYVDAYRVMHRSDGHHTWWPYDEAQRNGLRIDYQIVSPALAEYVFDAKIKTEPRLSPHCLLEIDYDFD